MMAYAFAVVSYMFAVSVSSVAQSCGSPFAFSEEQKASRCLLQVSRQDKHSTGSCPHAFGFKHGTDPDICEAERICLTQIRDPPIKELNDSEIELAVNQSKLYTLVLKDYLKTTKVSNQMTIPGTTLLVTIIHGQQLMEWSNIGHFAANFFPLIGRQALTRADRLLLWTVDEKSFMLQQKQTDWFSSVLDIISEHESPKGNHTSKMPLMFKLGNAEVCFEKLQLFSNPGWSGKPSLFSNQPAQCKTLRDRALAFFGLPTPTINMLSPSATVCKFLVTALVRDDDQSYSNIVPVTEKMRNFVNSRAGCFKAIWIPNDITNNGKFSLRMQIEALYNSDILISTHGAQLTNLVFMKPGARIVEIFKCRHTSTDFLRAADGCNLKYYSTRTTVPGLSHQYCNTNTRSREHGTYLNVLYNMNYEHDVKPVLSTAVEDFFDQNI
jgi:hypothetical protein